MKKSVLFICTDQWRWDCFGFMKHKNILTPNIDKLAKKSTVFTSHFAGIVPCGPARTTMLTGLYPFVHRSVTNGAPLDKRFTNIAKEAKKKGYDPKLYGYTDTSWDPRYLDNDSEKNFTYESPMEGFDPACHLPQGNPILWANYLNENGFKINDAKDLYRNRRPKKGECFIHEPYEIPTEHSDTSFLATQAIKDLQKKTDPFFMHISFLRPHPPMYVAEPWHSLVNPNDIELPFMNKTIEELSNMHPLFKEIAKKYTDEEMFSEIRFSDLNENDIRNIKSVYFGMCAEVDHYIGKILDALNDTNHADNTMIIFTSDHGEMLGENKLWGKSGWWDSSFRIPLIINVPNTSPKMLDTFTESVDIAPTILDWIEGEIPQDWNGQSLIPIIRDSKNKYVSKKYVVFDWDFRESHYSSFVEKKQLAPEECNLSVIRTKDWKYVHFPSLPPLLFNLTDDPYEINNLANESNYINIQNYLLSELLSHRMLHQERQLSNSMLTKKGVINISGPATRKLKG